MAECTKVTGTRANSMALEFILCLARMKDVDCGKKASVLNGSTKIRLIKLKVASLTIVDFLNFKKIKRQPHQKENFTSHQTLNCV